MTFSICATDGEVHGISIATKAPAVGSLAPFLSRNGALCTQSLVSVPLGVRAQRLLNDGSGVDAAFKTLVERDGDAAVRQLHGVDRWENTYTFSGGECVDWYGSRAGSDFTVAGNMLSGPEVVDAVADAFEATDSSKPMDERLLAGIRAGEDEGGDKRAEHAQSAAMKVFDPENPGLHHDLRVDDHEDPVTELKRVHEVAREDNEEWQSEYDVTDLQRYP